MSTDPRRPAWQHIAWMCGAHVASMTGFSTYPALLPRLQEAWGLTNAEAGFISGFFFAGYMAAVPVLTSLTDRVDARRVYAVAAVLAALGSGGFALFADGLVSAALFQGLLGVGIAGTYMPGLRVVTDNVHGESQSRAVSFYTSTFGAGLSISVLLAGFIADTWSWRTAFAVAAGGPVVAALLVLGGMPARRPPPAPPRKLLDFRPVLANRTASRYIFGYAVHCWELFGSRSWMVAFLTFSQTIAGAPALLTPIAIAAIANFASPVASILGNEHALRSGRVRVIPIAMALSGALTCAIGFAVGAPPAALLAIVILHMVLVMWDSSALTGGLVAESDPSVRGASMALHSTLGFGAGFVSPLVFGVTLDAAGGNESAFAWALAFATLGIGGIVAPLALGFGRRRD